MRNLPLARASVQLHPMREGRSAKGHGVREEEIKLAVFRSGVNLFLRAEPSQYGQFLKILTLLQ